MHVDITIKTNIKTVLNILRSFFPLYCTALIKYIIPSIANIIEIAGNAYSIPNINTTNAKIAMFVFIAISDVQNINKKTSIPNVIHATNKNILNTFASIFVLAFSSINIPSFYTLILNVFGANLYAINSETIEYTTAKHMAAIPKYVVGNLSCSIS